MYEHHSFSHFISYVGLYQQFSCLSENTFLLLLMKIIIFLLIWFIMFLENDEHNTISVLRFCLHRLLLFLLNDDSIVGSFKWKKINLVPIFAQNSSFSIHSFIVCTQVSVHAFMHLFDSVISLLLLLIMSNAHRWALSVYTDWWYAFR